MGPPVGGPRWSDVAVAVAVVYVAVTADTGLGAVVRGITLGLAWAVCMRLGKYAWGRIAWKRVATGSEASADAARAQAHTVVQRLVERAPRGQVYAGLANERWAVYKRRW